MHLSEGDKTGDCRSLHRFPERMERSHWHMHLELVYCAGSPVGYEIGTQHHVLDQDTLLLFWAAVPHKVTSNTPRSEVYVINTPAEDLMAWPLPQGFVRHLMRGQAVIVRPDTRFGEAAFVSWHEDMTSGDIGRERTARTEISCLVERLARAFNPADAPVSSARSSVLPKSQALLSKVISHVSQHCDADLSVARVSETLGYNPGYLSTRFRELSGVSLHSYIRHIKVSKARALLTSSLLNIEDVAWEAGFGSVRQFYEAIKLETGQTPRQIRQSATAG